jgi:hypothetical protein
MASIGFWVVAPIIAITAAILGDTQQRNAALGTLALSAPFAVVGAYMWWGRVEVDANRRARTFYALTDRRAIIVSERTGISIVDLVLGVQRARVGGAGGFVGALEREMWSAASMRVDTLDLARMTERWIDDEWGGRGTIVFAPERSLWRAEISRTPLVPCFEDIADVRRVHDEIVSACTRARASASSLPPP